MERVVDPIVADIQAEHDAARRTGRRRRAAIVRISGYIAFWKAMALQLLASSSGSVWRWIAADEREVGRMIGCSLAVFFCVTLLLCAWPISGFYSQTHAALKLTVLLLPQAIPLSIPIALLMGVAWSVPADRVTAASLRRVLTLGLVATMAAFTVMQLVPIANQAFRVTLVEELEEAGVTHHAVPRGPSELSLGELASRAAADDASGLAKSARTLRWTYHLRLAISVAAPVLGLVGLGICRVWRGRTPRILSIVVVIGLYWGCLALGERNPTLPAAAVAWAPNLVLSALALTLLTVVRDDDVQGPSTAHT
jgi:hypothetical protein